MYTNIINVADDDIKPSTSSLNLPPPCDPEDLYNLAEDCGLIDLRERIGQYLINTSTGKTLLRRLCGPISLEHPRLYNAYYELFKWEWGSLEFRREFIAYLNDIDGVDDDEKERVSALLRRAIIEMQFSGP